MNLPKKIGTCEISMDHYVYPNTAAIMAAFLSVIEKEEKRCLKPQFDTDYPNARITEWNNGVHSLARQLKDRITEHMLAPKIESEA